MKSKSEKDNRQKRKNIPAFVSYYLFIAGPILFAIGCEESSLNTFGDYEFSDIASPGAQAVRIIQYALSDTNAAAKVNATEVVATTGQVRFMPQVQRLLHDEFTPVRFAAALAIGDMRYSPAKEQVSKLLSDKDVNVIIAASYAMGRLGSTEYFEVVRKALNSNDQIVRANAAFILGKTGDKSFLNLLISAQEDKNSTDQVKYQILEARARLGDEEVLQGRLWALVFSAFVDERVIAVRAMGLLGTSKARDILVTKLDDTVLEVRLVVAEQLGRLNDRIGEAEVLDVFEQNLTDSLDREAIERVNVLTALAIGEICSPALEKFLPRLLKNESKFVRIAAAKAVFQCKIN